MTRGRGTAADLAVQLDQLAADNTTQLLPGERQALADAAKQLRGGTSPLWALTSLLRKVLPARWSSS